MNDNLPLAQSLLQIFVARTEMVDPDRSVRENQFRRSLFSPRRRPMFFKLGIVPPREANRRALSRSMRALRASRTRAVFSANAGELLGRAYEIVIEGNSSSYRNLQMHQVQHQMMTKVYAPIMAES